MTESASAVARYYDRVQWLYNLGWSAGGSRSLHYGLWWDGTRSLAEAIGNGDRFVAEKLAVRPSDHVLDMGCGVGGTSVFLARAFGCRVTGVTVSGVQLAQATRYAAASGVGHLARFELMDYAATAFPDGTFTKAFTQESANYAADKRALVREAHRVLAPGGCYVSLDAFQRRDARPGAEEARLRRVLRGWACGGVERFDRYVALAGEVGFDVVEGGDLSPRAARSARAIWRRHAVLYPLAWLARGVGLAPAELLWHFQASIGQKHMHCAADSVLMFGYLVARKPLAGEHPASADDRARGAGPGAAADRGHESRFQGGCRSRPRLLNLALARFRNTSCDPFGIPSTSPWTGAAITGQAPRTTNCIVTGPRPSRRPTLSSLAALPTK